MSERSRQPVHLKEKFSLIQEHFSPRVVVRVDNYEIRIAKLQGEFVWHSHENTDELFLVHKGILTIHLRDGEVVLGKGDMYVVPRGVAHRPVAAKECEILMFERAGTRNTGDASGDLTVDEPPWV